MPDSQSQKVPITLLQAIYNAVEEQTQPNLNPILEVADILNRSKESVYRRFRGESAFTFHELWLLSQHYIIPFASIFSQTDQKALSVNLLELNKLVSSSDLHVVTRPIIPNPHVSYFLFTNSIPIQHIKATTSLLWVKQKFWKNLYNWRKSIDLPNTICSALKGHEVWSDTVSVFMLQELDFVLACGVEMSFDQLFDWYKELVILLRSCILDDELQSDLYQSEVSFPSSLLVSMGNKPSVHIFFSDLLVGESGSSMHAEPLQIWATQMMNQCIKITGQSVRLKRLFYASLVKPVMESARKRLTEEQYYTLSTLVK